jgi:hypothetical protein
MGFRAKHRQAAAERRRATGADEGLTLDEAASAGILASLRAQPAAEIAAPLNPPTRLREPTDYEVAILSGLQMKPTYQGPVPDHRFRGRKLSEEVIADRRRRTRLARRADRKRRSAA